MISIPQEFFYKLFIYQLFVHQLSCMRVTEKIFRLDDYLVQHNVGNEHQGRMDRGIALARETLKLF